MTFDSIENQFEDIKLKLSNLALIVEDYPVLKQGYEDGDFETLGKRVEDLYKTFGKMRSIKNDTEVSETQQSHLSQLSDTLKSIVGSLENSELVKQAGMEYLKDYDMYEVDDTQDSEELTKEIENLDKIRVEQESKIKILKEEISKLTTSNEELENEVEKLKNETSEEQKEYELAQQKKEIENLQKEIQLMELKIREGQEELENLNGSPKDEEGGNS